MCADGGPTAVECSEPKGHYCRLFEPATQPLTADDEDKLVQLGEAMRYDVEREGTLTPRVGYTYFGHFVGHDLTRNTTPLEAPYLNPELTPSYRTSYLDLDHVYGGKPQNSPHLYCGQGSGIRRKTERCR
jgi:hypothetical protein